MVSATIIGVSANSVHLGEAYKRYVECVNSVHLRLANKILKLDGLEETRQERYRVRLEINKEVFYLKFEEIGKSHKMMVSAVSNLIVSLRMR